MPLAGEDGRIGTVGKGSAMSGSRRRRRRETKRSPGRLLRGVAPRHRWRRSQVGEGEARIHERGAAGCQCLPRACFRHRVEKRRQSICGGSESTVPGLGIKPRPRCRLLVLRLTEHLREICRDAVGLLIAAEPLLYATPFGRSFARASFRPEQS
ncbi:unnamed protein product [Ixodes persulcatus]